MNYTPHVSSLRHPLAQELFHDRNFDEALGYEEKVDQLLASGKRSKAILAAKAIPYPASRDRALLAIVRANPIGTMQLVDCISEQILKNMAYNDIADRYFSSRNGPKAYLVIQKCEDSIIVDSFCDKAIPRLITDKQIALAKNFFYLLSNGPLQSTHLSSLVVAELQAGKLVATLDLLSGVTDAEAHDMACKQAALYCIDKDYQISIQFVELMQNIITKQLAYKELLLRVSSIDKPALKLSFIQHIQKRFGVLTLYSLLRFLIENKKPEFAGLLAMAIPHSRRIQNFVDTLIHEGKYYEAICIALHCPSIQIAFKQYLCCLDSFIQQNALDKIRFVAAVIPGTPEQKSVKLGMRAQILFERGELQMAYYIACALLDPQKSTFILKIVEALVAKGNFPVAETLINEIQIPEHKNLALSTLRKAQDALMIPDSYNVLRIIEEEQA